MAELLAELVELGLQQVVRDLVVAHQPRHRRVVRPEVEADIDRDRLAHGKPPLETLVWARRA
jgi:hypothetical protein